MEEWEDPGDREWQPPVVCPECSSEETSLEGIQSGFRVFVCECCGCRFEIDLG